MHIPVIQGTIRRRILANYRVDPSVVEKLLPRPFRPKLIQQYAMVGICLIRLEHIRPRFFQPAIGIHSENAAHRIAVEWLDHGILREGVYIARRDSDSWVNTLVGGRLFPGEHHHAQFTTIDDHPTVSVHFRSDDHKVQVTVKGHSTPELPGTSVFPSLQLASAFFAGGALGYSVTHDPNLLDGIELKSRMWHVEPLEVEHITSSYFEDATLFPPGAITFDCALLMRNIPHEWHSHHQLRTG